ncbi:unnamed protein product, partial [Meganyctiphanes norvegica]
PVLDLSKPPFTHNIVPNIFPPPEVTPDPLEYLERPADLDEAIYAGHFAMELRRLEHQDNDIFTNFITDGFVSDEVPRHLPKMLLRLSRKASRFFANQGSSAVGHVSSRTGNHLAGIGAPPPSSSGGVGGPPAPSTGVLPIEKGRLVTKTTTTDFGSVSPLHVSRTGRIHENKFQFPSVVSHGNKFRFPSLSQGFLNQNIHFTY